MKTYRLYSLKLLVLNEERKINSTTIVLNDGLIINMEDGQGRWLIEAVTDPSARAIFELLQEKEGEFLVEVVITSNDNFPATMEVKVREITELSESISVLLDGVLVINKDDVIETILNELVDEGLTGEMFLAEFKRRKTERKRSDMK